MFSKDVIMIVLENTYVEVISKWYINSVVQKKKTVWVHRLPAICKDVFCCNWVIRESRKDVLI